MRLALPTQARWSLERLGLNSLWLLLARFGAQGMSVVFAALLARRLGAAGLGEFSILSSVVFLGNVLTTFGTDSLLIREIARMRRAAFSLVSTSFWIQVSLSILFISAVFLWNEGSPALPLYALSLLPLALTSVYSAVLRGFERMDLYLCLNLAAAALQLACGIAVLLLHADLVGLVALLLVCQVITAALAWRLGRNWIGLRFVRRAPQLLGPTVRLVLPFALLTTCSLLFQRMGLLTLGAWSTADATGWFSAAARIVEALKIVPQALLGALFPMLARRAEQSRLLPFGRASLRLSVAFCLVAALGSSLLASPLILLIYGEGFLLAAHALQILAWGLVPYAVTATLSLELVAQGREWSALRGTLAGGLFAALLFALWVPHFGLTGACWASLTAESFQAAGFLVSRRAARAHRP